MSSTGRSKGEDSHYTEERSRRRHRSRSRSRSRDADRSSSRRHRDRQDDDNDRDRRYRHRRDEGRRSRRSRTRSRSRSREKERSIEKYSTRTQPEREPAGISIKVAPPSLAYKSSPALNAGPLVKSSKVAAIFNDEDDDEPEEMPPEARMKMKNIGRNTPTSAGPNSFGKTKIGFCNTLHIAEKELEEQQLK